MTKIRVVIVDDHAIVRQGLLLMLQNVPDLEVVGNVADGNTALHLVRQLQPHVLILDLLMPGMDGVEVIRQIRNEQLACRVLVLTSSLQDRLLQEAVSAGADGYFLKTSDMTDIIEAVRHVARGEAAFDPIIVRNLLSYSHQQDLLNTLTVREREVFDYLARGQSYPEIAEQLGVSDATIRTHGTSVLDKLNLRDRTQVMVYALKRGLVRPEDLP
jgi:NarL family two-component system response regulator LiaR